MEDQWDLMLGSPTAKHGASPFMPEVEYPSLPLDLLCGLARRRIQNREAQRRFRERKEQRKNSLQKNAEELHRDYQTLLTQYADTVSDVTRLVQENGVLRFEIRKLRQQWRLLLTIIQRLQGSQSPGASRESAFNFDDVQDYLEDLGIKKLVVIG
ncbi:bZIP transcription factor [Talaromyces pinophilus]|uniref:BZIP transcription factor n=1 Tax=Talaromyces pinophilus TaxID=128442 RepID=A0A478ECU6_TALPI|nr:bZIP transcription factor [Talaromyces pinophilus]